MERMTNDQLALDAFNSHMEKVNWQLDGRVVTRPDGSEVYTGIQTWPLNAKGQMVGTEHLYIAEYKRQHVS